MISEIAVYMNLVALVFRAPNTRGWPTGLEPATFGATMRRHRLPRVAGSCKNRLSKPIRLLVVARCFWVLRSGWCQRWCQVASTSSVARWVLVGAIPSLGDPKTR